jgi:hypothetical protein
MTYTPDKWLVVKIEGKEFPLTYKVFACWHGGYLDGDDRLETKEYEFEEKD